MLFGMWEYPKSCLLNAEWMKEHTLLIVYLLFSIESLSFRKFTSNFETLYPTAHTLVTWSYLL